MEQVKKRTRILIFIVSISMSFSAFFSCSFFSFADSPKTPLEYSLFEVENGIDSKNNAISLYLAGLRNQDVVFDFGGVTYTYNIRYYFRYYKDWQISGLTPSDWFNANGVNEWNGTETIEFSIDNYNGLFDYPINKGGVFDIQFNFATEGVNFAYAYEPYIILHNKEHTKQQIVTDVKLLQTTGGYFRFVFEDITADFDIYYFDVRIFAFPNVSSINDYSRIEATTNIVDFCYITELESDALLNKIGNKLDDILNIEGNSDLSNLDDSKVNNAIQDESDLLNKDTEIDTALDVEYNSQGIGVIWDIIDRFVTGNPKVFALVITMLSLGVICLILNRR